MQLQQMGAGNGGECIFRRFGPGPKGLSNYFDEGKSERSSLTGICDEEIRDEGRTFDS